MAKTPTGPPSPDVKSLRRRLLFFQILTALLAAVVLGISTRRWFKLHTMELGLSSIQKDAPYAGQVSAILKPLRYSTLPSLLRNDVRLEIDFASRSWRLKNIRSFTPDGRIALDQGRYGACGELSAYMWQKIRPIFSDRYTIQLARVAESSYFPAPSSSHYVLWIIDRESPRTPFILDPSFHRYGRVAFFEDYRFYNVLPALNFMKTHDRDEHLLLGSSLPVLIKNEVLVDMGMEDIDGRFDPDNYALTLRAIQRYNYAGKRLLTFRRADGGMDVREDRQLGVDLLGREGYRQLKTRLEKIFEAAETIPAKER